MYVDMVDFAIICLTCWLAAYLHFPSKTLGSNDIVSPLYISLTELRFFGRINTSIIFGNIICTYVFIENLIHFSLTNKYASVVCRELTNFDYPFNALINKQIDVFVADDF